MNEFPIPDKVKSILLPQEDIEFMAKPLKSVYDKKVKSAIIAAFLLPFGFGAFVIIGFKLFTGFYIDDLSGFVLSILYIAGSVAIIITPLSLLGAYFIHKSYPNSFYGYSNMRIICTNEYGRVLFFYFKDIHEIAKAGEYKVSVDTNDYVGEYSSSASKKIHKITGVEDTTTFVNIINEKVLPFRIPPK